MSIAEYYYPHLKRYFAKFAKRLVIILLISDQEIHYFKRHLVKRPEIEDVVPCEREILAECGLIRRN